MQAFEAKDLADIGFPESGAALQDAVVPRPVYLVSTISKSGVNNVAPYNLRASGELVINAVTEPIVNAANACAENLPPHKSEFEFAGLTPVLLTSLRRLQNPAC